MQSKYLMLIAFHLNLIQSDLVQQVLEKELRKLRYYSTTFLPLRCVQLHCTCIAGNRRSKLSFVWSNVSNFLWMSTKYT